MNTPAVFNQFLSDNGCLDMLYKAMKSKDFADVVLAAKNALTLSGAISNPFQKQNKSVIQSAMYRNQGNQAYALGDYRKAFEYYNLALLNAPYQSTAMKLAYSNRSAVLFSAKLFGACLKDISRCLALGDIDNDILEKLKRRRIDCLTQVPKEEFEKIVVSSIISHFFLFNERRNPQIPSVSSVVNIIKETGTAKVIASRDVKVGTVVAIETAFVGELNKKNRLISCHYCHQVGPNLIPCVRCCVTLFCDEQCRAQCNAEYHNIECQMTEFLETINQTCRINIRTVLKMRHMSRSWDELITASQRMGKRRMNDSSINEIYDVNNKFSILNFDSAAHYLYGNMYNLSFQYAMVLNVLEKIPSFLPKIQSERNEAMRAIARIMMHLHFSQAAMEINNSALDGITKQDMGMADPNWGYFPFTSKLNHRCDANLLVVGLKNKAALVAVKPIIKGAELNISHIGNWYERNYTDNSDRRLMLFVTRQIICNCLVCEEKWSHLSLKESQLSVEETAAFNKWMTVRDKAVSIKCLEIFFGLTCQTLALLSKSPCTKEHLQVFLEFRKILSFCQSIATENVVFSD